MRKSHILRAMISVALIQVSQLVLAANFVWYNGHDAITCQMPRKYEPVVKEAMDMFSSDMKAVTGKSAVVTKGRSVIKIVEADKATSAELGQYEKQGIPIKVLEQKNDGFYISIVNDQIVIIGKNGRGTAYGLLELSRMAGVNPWIWWGDEKPAHKDKLTIDDKYTTLQGASVEYRGIFLNDEDWSLRPWSCETFEKLKGGAIGPKTYKKIFQLLLRLRANAIWPAMHPGTTAFFKVPGNKAMADSCGIFVGSSHCEPLLRNNVDEWDVSNRGQFNYITNKNAVQNYWIERLKEVKNSKVGNMFTIGMRGIHDGSMEGVKTMQEKFDALQQVINDQQDLLRKYIDDPSKQMQVFIPYKEVLQIYEKGLKVPDYVTLMWCDDNYGYMTRLSDTEEQKRRGGAGVYYHLSYWGQPHDYLWLTTMQPGLIYNEMRAAYDHNLRKLWIVNVHDPKVAGYDLELFLDMAWDINSVKGNTLEDHYQTWLCRQFGKEAGEKLFPLMKEYYRLCGERHPEFMGWSQTELDKKLYDFGLSPQRNTEFTDAFGGELDRYLDRYASVAASVKDVEKMIPSRLKDAYFAAIEYPVLASDANARKLLWAQRARQWASGSTLKDMFVNNPKIYHACAESQSAYQEIRSLTDYYNNTMAGGKWRHLMSMRPRDLPVFGAPNLPTLLTDEEVKEWLGKGNDSIDRQTNVCSVKNENVIAHNACEYVDATDGTQTVQMLGHSMNAVALPQGCSVSYRFTTKQTGDYDLRIALIPTQPNDNGDIRFSVKVDGDNPVVLSLKEPFHSENWKTNVLRDQAVKTLTLKNFKAGRHTLIIKALDQHIIVDQWMIDNIPNLNFYLFPTSNQDIVNQ